MAYIVNTLQTSVAVAATYTASLGPHIDGDLLLVLLSQDGGGTTIAPDATATTAGWAMIPGQAIGTACRQAWAYKIVGTGEAPVANPTFTGANDDWIATCLVIRDAHATAPFGSVVSGTDYVRTNHAAAYSTTSGSLTTAVDECLLIYSWNADGVSNYIRCKTEQLPSVDLHSPGNVAHVIGAIQQASAAAAPTVTMYQAGSTGGQGWVLAVRNKSGGVLQPTVRTPTTAQLKMYGSFGTAHDGTVTWQAADQFAATINGITASSVAPTIYGGVASTDYTWGTYTTVTSSDNTTGLWCGGTHAITSTDMTGKVFYLQYGRSYSASNAMSGAEGNLVGFSDGTNWVVYQISNAKSGWPLACSGVACIALGAATPYASSGSIDWSAVTRVAYLYHRIGSSGTGVALGIKNALLLGTAALTGGGANRPATFYDLARQVNSWGVAPIVGLQGSAQVLAKGSVRIGDGGTNKTYFDAAASSIEYPPEWSATKVDNWQMDWNATANALTLDVYAGASDTINFASGVAAAGNLQNLAINASSSTSATYSFAQSFVGWTPTWKTGVNVAGATFSECGEIDAQGSTWTDCTIKKTVSTDAAIAFTSNSGAMTRVVVDVTGTSAAYHVDLGASVTAITFTDVTFTGTPATDKVHVKATTGTVTITLAGSTSLAAGDVTSDGATVVISAPTLQRGLAFTGLLVGSKVKVFNTGTDTEAFSTASSSTSETWDDATSGSKTVDYVIQKAGYLPIRVVGVTVTGAVTGGIQSVPVSQVVARWYVASAGLTINTNVFANASTKLFGLTTASTLQNLASYLMEQWIALGDTGEAFANKAFPIEANGPNSFTWLYDWEADLTTYPNTITNLSRDGMRYLNTAGTRTAAWCALLSVGVSSGMRVRFQQSDGGTTNSAAVTSGNIDQLIQIYGDASHGNFDRTGYLVAKVQEMGYDQAEVDVVAQYGTLEDQLYVIGLNPLANGVATGNPALANPPVITDHGASPVTWHSKAFSITITDSAAGNTATNIMRWLRYNFETGGAFQSKDGFDWHDLVQTNGDAFKTVRGIVYGDTGAALKGVRVVQNDGSTEHAGFTLFTADDGTTYAPVIPVTAGAIVLAGSRVQLYNVDTDTEIDNAVEASTSYAYTITTEASDGDTLRLRVTKLGYEPVEVFGVFDSAAGATFLVTQVADAIYTTWGIDGSTVTEFALDVTGTIEIDANDADGATTKTRLGAWYNYALTTEDGIRSAFGSITALAANAIRINVGVLDLQIENTNASTALRFTDNEVRLYRSDGTSIIAATSYSIHNDYSGVPDIVETGVSGLTGPESAQLMSLTNAPSEASTAAAVIALAQTSPIYADIRKVKGQTIAGSGSEADPWGP